MRIGLEISTATTGKWSHDQNRHRKENQDGGVVADRQRDSFLTVVGATCFERLVDLLAPCAPADVPLDETIDLFVAY